MNTVLMLVVSATAIGRQGDASLSVPSADEGYKLLMSTPSYEFLCYLEVEPARLRTLKLDHIIALIMPRPLAQCKTAVITDTMKKLSGCSTETIYKIVERCDAEAKGIASGKVVPGTLKHFMETKYARDRIELAFEIHRKCAIMLRYIFELPSVDMYPWVTTSDGTLTLTPSAQKIPHDNLGSYSNPLNQYWSASMHPRRK